MPRDVCEGRLELLQAVLLLSLGSFRNDTMTLVSSRVYAHVASPPLAEHEVFSVLRFAIKQNGCQDVLLRIVLCQPWFDFAMMRHVPVFWSSWCLVRVLWHPAD